jgi:hypothetical protein
MVTSLVSSAVLSNQSGQCHGGFMMSRSHNGSPQHQLEECRTLYCQGKSMHSEGYYVDAVRLDKKAVYLQELLLGKYHQDTIKAHWR